ncbi:MAG: helix-turn-helix transcriptional regulator [Desulfovibrio sp.]|jgi:DNA-binding XRE family transcriptional regulator|nr:helix-turn-helix transcriptional regulator [Desulfovibrio sp.]
MIDAKTVHKRMLREDADYAREYEALGDEFALAETLVRARSARGLTQTQVAERLGVAQPAVARIESGRNVSLKTLRRYAGALGCRVELRLVPSKG